MAHAFRAEPLAVRDGRQGWGEARVMISLIALCARARVVGTIEGKRAAKSRGLPYRTRVGRRDRCGISCTRPACLIRRGAVADRSISRRSE